MKNLFTVLSAWCIITLVNGFFYIEKADAQSVKPTITNSQLKEIAKDKTPAIQIAYLNHNKVELYNYGVKNVNTGEAIDSQTIFQAASLSKVVATYVFLILADKGLLDLDKPLWEYYEYARLRNDPHRDVMTARHVLTHQTGLVNWVGSAHSNAWKKSELKLTFKPGTDYRYSGEAYYYLQLVAEKITSKSLDELCVEFIFKPFGMKKSRYVYNEEIGKNIAVGHKDDVISNEKIQKFANGNAAYTLYTTAEEYMNFILAGVLNGEGMSKKMHQDFLTPKVATAAKGKEKEKDKYLKCCFGIRSQENEAGIAYWHTGSNGGGFKCVFLVYPATKQAITIFTNASKGDQVKLPIFNQVFGNHQTYWLAINE